MISVPKHCYSKTVGLTRELRNKCVRVSLNSLIYLFAIYILTEVTGQLDCLSLSKIVNIQHALRVILPLQCLFENAEQNIQQLHTRENWQLSQEGGHTALPLIFQNIVLSLLSTVRDVSTTC